MYNDKQRSDRKPFNKAPTKGGDNQGQVEEILSHQPVQAEPLQVEVYGNFERALRAFRTLCQREKVLSIFKEKQSYEKPSDKKRRKKAESKRKVFEDSFKTDDSVKEKKQRKFKREEEVTE